MGIRMHRKLAVMGVVLFAGVALCLTVCDGSPPAPAPAAPSTRPAEVPAEGVLTLATKDDVKNAPKYAANVAIQKAVNDYLAKPAQRWTIDGARPVGDYVLLWISFPDFKDGGIDLIYSVKDQRVHWTFLGGYRG